MQRGASCVFTFLWLVTRGASDWHMFSIHVFYVCILCMCSMYVLLSQKGVQIHSIFLKTWKLIQKIQAKPSNSLKSKANPESQLNLQTLFQSKAKPTKYANSLNLLKNWRLIQKSQLTLQMHLGFGARRVPPIVIVFWTERIQQICCRPRGPEAPENRTA